MPWFESDMSSHTIGRPEVAGKDKNGAAISAQACDRYLFGRSFSLAPRAQSARTSTWEA